MKNASVEISEELIDRAQVMLQELVSIDSTNPPGNESKIAAYVASQLEAAGYTAKLLESVPGRANVIATKGGRQKKGGVILSAHADTVPVTDAQRWQESPFSGCIRDEMIWGRGTLDMKFKIAFDLALMQWAADKDLQYSLQQLVVADEECGGQHGSQFIIDNFREELSGVYVSNEMGGFPVYIAGKPLFVLQSGEKGSITFTLEIDGQAVHASTPTKQLRLETMMQHIATFAENLNVFSVCESARAFCQGLAQIAPPEMQAVLEGLLVQESVNTSLDILTAVDGMLAGQVGAMLFSCCTPTVIRFGETANVLSNSGTVQCDCRVVPGQSISDYIDRIHTEAKKLAEIAGVSVEVTKLESVAGYEIDLNDALFKRCIAQMQESWAREKNAPVVPYLLPASSDSSHYAQASLMPIGFSPLLFEPGFAALSLVHGRDERVPIAAFRAGLRLYIQTLGGYALGH